LSQKSSVRCGVENLQKIRTGTANPNPVPPHIPRQFAVPKEDTEIDRKNYKIIVLVVLLLYK